MSERPRIQFINHAGYVLHSGGVRLAVDPWIEGRAFNDCWALTSPTSLTYDDFRDVTHIWFSHEHPDHFSPQNLKKIPESYRRRITVLYQTSKDRRVVDWCRANGFGQVIELPDRQAIHLAPDFEVLCCSVGAGDSWLLSRTKGMAILNMNDCLLRERAPCEQVHELVGPIDLLLTQFSSAAWDGNPADIERRRRGARQMLDQAILQTNVLRPKYVIPFASFVRFCHQDNAFMNAAANRIDAAVQALAEATEAEPVVLYPGDEWVPGESHDNGPAMRRYLADHVRVEQEPLVACRSATEQELQQAATKFQAILLGTSSRLRLRLSLARQTAWRRRRDARQRGVWRRFCDLLSLAMLRTDAALIHLHDLGRSYSFDPLKGLRLVDLPRGDCDIVTDSQSLCYAFRMMWGGETMLIAGTFEEVRPDSREVLFSAFDMAKGYSLGSKLLWRSIPLRLLRRFRRNGHPAASP